MPLYEYHCNQCEAHVELLVRSNSEPAQCPDCGSLKLTKELSVAAAPAHSGGQNLPVHRGESSASGTCGRPQCGTGCMFD